MIWERRGRFHIKHVQRRLSFDKGFYVFFARCGFNRTTAGCTMLDLLAPVARQNGEPRSASRRRCRTSPAVGRSRNDRSKVRVCPARLALRGRHSCRLLSTMQERYCCLWTLNVTGQRVRRASPALTGVRRHWHCRC
jgi:hypothetical protein